MTMFGDRRLAPSARHQRRLVRGARHPHAPDRRPDSREHDRQDGQAGGDGVGGGRRRPRGARRRARRPDRLARRAGSAATGTSSTPSAVSASWASRCAARTACPSSWRRCTTSISSTSRATRPSSSTGDGRLLADSNVQLSRASQDDRQLVMSLDLPASAVPTDWNVFVVRDGDPVMVVGTKTTIQDLTRAPAQPLDRPHGRRLDQAAAAAALPARRRAPRGLTPDASSFPAEPRRLKLPRVTRCPPSRCSSCSRPPPRGAPSAEEQRLYAEGLTACERGRRARRRARLVRRATGIAHDPAFLVRIGEAEEKAGAPGRGGRDLPALPARGARRLRPRRHRAAPRAARAGPRPRRAAARRRRRAAAVSWARRPTPTLPTAPRAARRPRRGRGAAAKRRPTTASSGWNRYNVTAMSAAGASVLLLGTAAFFGAEAASKESDVNRLQGFRDETTGAPVAYSTVARQYEARPRRRPRATRTTRGSRSLGAAGAAAVAVVFFVLDAHLRARGRPSRSRPRRERRRRRRSSPRGGSDDPRRDAASGSPLLLAALAAACFSPQGARLRVLVRDGRRLPAPRTSAAPTVCVTARTAPATASSIRSTAAPD